MLGVSRVDRQTSDVTLAGPPASGVDASLTWLMHSRCHAPGSASGESFCARPILLLYWRCIPTHEPGARHRSPSPPNPLSESRILEIRIEPPENLQRIPGPEAILSFLHHDPALKAAGVRLPR